LAEKAQENPHSDIINFPKESGLVGKSPSMLGGVLGEINALCRGRG